MLSAMPSLLELSDDVLLEIMKFLFDPEAIRSLRLTCQRLSSVSYHHAVWLNILRVLCYTHTIPFSTFNNSQSMTAEDLEKVAVRPLRFLQKISSDDPKPLRERIVTFKHPVAPEVGISTSEVVRGGRYIIIRYHNLDVGLWDMRLDNKSVSTPEPVLRALHQLQDFQGCVEQARFVCQHDSPRGDFVVVTSHEQPEGQTDERRCRVETFPIDGRDNLPEPVLCCEWNAPPSMSLRAQTLFLQGQLYLLWQRSTLVVLLQASSARWIVVRPSLGKGELSKSRCYVEHVSKMDDRLLILLSTRKNNSKQWCIFDVETRMHGSLSEALNNPLQTPVHSHDYEFCGEQYSITRLSNVFQPEGIWGSNHWNGAFVREIRKRSFRETCVDIYATTHAARNNSDASPSLHIPRLVEDSIAFPPHPIPERGDFGAQLPRFVVIGRSAVRFSWQSGPSINVTNLEATTGTRTKAPEDDSIQQPPNSVRTLASMRIGSFAPRDIDVWRGKIYYLAHEPHLQLTEVDDIMASKAHLNVLDFVDI